MRKFLFVLTFVAMVVGCHASPRPVVPLTDKEQCLVLSDELATLVEKCEINTYAYAFLTVANTLSNGAASCTKTRAIDDAAFTACVAWTKAVACDRMSMPMPKACLTVLGIEADTP